MTDHSELKLFIKEAIEKDKTFSEVLDIKISAGTNSGDNMASDLLKALVRVKTNNDNEQVLNLVCKSESIGVGAEWTKWLQLFKKEAEYYRTIAPTLTEFQRSIGVDPLPNAIPKYYGSDIDIEGKVNRILLEDVRPLGFKMMDKSVGLSNEEVLLALAELAKLHGLSYAIKVSRKKELLELFPMAQDFAHTTPDWEDSGEGPFGIHFRDAAERFTELGRTDIASRMEKYIPTAYRHMYKILKYPQESPYSTLIHGDFWINNLLYKYDDNGSPNEVLFVDFQFIGCTNFFKDISYFIYCSTSGENRKKHLKTWLKHHHEHLIKTIQHCKVPVPEDFAFETYEKKFLEGLDYALIWMPFACAMQHGDPEINEAANKVSFEERLGVGEFKNSSELSVVKKLFRCKLVMEKLTEVMEDLIELGAL